MTLEQCNPLLFDSPVIAVGSVSSQMFRSLAGSIPRFGTFFHSLSVTGEKMSTEYSCQRKVW